MGKLSTNFVSVTLAGASAAALLVVGLTACKPPPPVPPPPPPPPVCFDYDNFDGDSPVVKFGVDVLPIFRKSCGLSTACHGAPTSPSGQPYLGSDVKAGTMTTAQIKAIFDQNVAFPASKAKTMMIVEPESPENSFLMHKIDDTLDCEPVECEADCGARMPKDAAVLSQAERDVVRRWIAQGAKND